MFLLLEITSLHASSPVRRLVAFALGQNDSSGLPRRRFLAAMGSGALFIAGCSGDKESTAPITKVVSTSDEVDVDLKEAAIKMINASIADLRQSRGEKNRDVVAVTKFRNNFIERGILVNGNRYASTQRRYRGSTKERIEDVELSVGLSRQTIIDFSAHIRDGHETGKFIKMALAALCIKEAAYLEEQESSPEAVLQSANNQYKFLAIVNKQLKGFKEDDLHHAAEDFLRVFLDQECVGYKPMLTFLLAEGITKEKIEALESQGLIPEALLNFSKDMKFYLDQFKDRGILNLEEVKKNVLRSKLRSTDNDDPAYQAIGVMAIFDSRLSPNRDLTSNEIVDEIYNILYQSKQ